MSTEVTQLVILLGVFIIGLIMGYLIGDRDYK